MMYEEFNSTRVGPYLWDIDVDAMGIEELRALEQLCCDRREQKEKELRYANRLKKLLKEAAEDNIQLIYSNEDCYVNLTAGRESIAAEEKEYWVE